MAHAAGTTARIVHIPSDVIARFNPEWGASLVGDKAHSMIFGNSKIKRGVPDFSATVPFSWGVREIMAWYDADLSRQEVDEYLNHLMDEIISRYEAV